MLRYSGNVSQGSGLSTWSPITAYNITTNEFVEFTVLGVSKIFKSLQDNNINHLPSDPAWWVETSPSVASNAGHTIQSNLLTFLQRSKLKFLSAFSVTDNSGNDSTDIELDLSTKADLVGGKVPAGQLPSYVDDVLEYPSFGVFPFPGEAGKIYVALNSNKIYRYTGTTYVEVSQSIQLGETSSTAYQGDRGKIAYDLSHVQNADYKILNNFVGSNNANGIKGNSAFLNMTYARSFNSNALSSLSLSGIKLSPKYLTSGLVNYRFYLCKGTLSIGQKLYNHNDVGNLIPDLSSVETLNNVVLFVDYSCDIANPVDITIPFVALLLDNTDYYFFSVNISGILANGYYLSNTNSPTLAGSFYSYNIFRSGAGNWVSINAIQVNDVWFQFNFSGISTKVQTNSDGTIDIVGDALLTGLDTTQTPIAKQTWWNLSRKSIKSNIQNLIDLLYSFYSSNIKGHTIQSNTQTFTQRSKLKFLSAFSVTDNSGNDSTDIDLDLSTKADLVGGKVPAGQLPSYVDDVLEYANLVAFPAIGETGKIYIATDTNKTYRWTGTIYVEVSQSIQLGETSSTAYQGDKGKIAYDLSHVQNTDYKIEKSATVGGLAVNNMHTNSGSGTDNSLGFSFKATSNFTLVSIDVPFIANVINNTNNLVLDIYDHSLVSAERLLTDYTSSQFLTGQVNRTTGLILAPSDTIKNYILSIPLLIVNGSTYTVLIYKAENMWNAKTNIKASCYEDNGDSIFRSAATSGLNVDATYNPQPKIGFKLYSLSTTGSKVQTNVEGTIDIVGDALLTGLDTTQLPIAKQTWWNLLSKSIKLNIQNLIDLLYALKISLSLVAISGNGTDLNLTNGKVLIGNSSGKAVEADTVASSLTVGDFTGIYTPFAIESNWVNNLYTGAVIAGILGDKMYGEFENGTWGGVENTQYGWKRYYNNSKINVSTILGGNINNALVLSSNWSISGIYTSTTVGYGDVGQWHTDGIYKYECIFNDGTNHIWMRTEASLGVPIVIPDVTYIPYFATVTILNNSVYSIPAKHKLISIIAETLDTLGGNFSAGSSVGASNIINLFALSTVANTLKDLVYIQLDSMLSSTLTKNVYITISTATTVKLHIIFQKSLN